MTSLTLTPTSRHDATRTGAARTATAAAAGAPGLRRRLAGALAFPSLVAGLLLSVVLYLAPVVAVALLVL